ncbi:hypothetical protein C4577_05420 [Candidatus Parcubacteria bacterium]|nr:MAG: hypothetical protein C4577_05420 [Candidatus Parcubacteria bacterium]
MNKARIREVAKVLEKEEEIDSIVINYILKILSKTELRSLVNYLKIQASENKVYLKASIEDKEIIKEVERIFKGKEIIFEKDQALGGGIIVKYKDDVIDLSLSGYINQLTSTLKENI